MFLRSKPSAPDEHKNIVICPSTSCIQNGQGEKETAPILPVYWQESESFVLSFKVSSFKNMNSEVKTHTLLPHLKWLHLRTVLKLLSFRNIVFSEAFATPLMGIISC